MNFVGRKTHRSNFGDIPTINQHNAGDTEESRKFRAIIYRAILSFESGKTKRVSYDDDVDVENGVFKRPPIRITGHFHLQPGTSPLFMKGYFAPFHKERDTDSCLAILESPNPSVIPANFHC